MNRATEFKHTRYVYNKGKTHVVDVATSNITEQRNGKVFHSLATPHFAIYLVNTDGTYASDILLDEETARFVLKNLNDYVNYMDKLKEQHHAPL